MSDERTPIVLELTELEMTQLLHAVDLLTTSMVQLKELCQNSRMRELYVASLCLEKEVEQAVRRHYDPRFKEGK